MDILNPVFEAGSPTKTKDETPAQMTPSLNSTTKVSMKNSDVKRRITVEELQAQDPQKPWVRTFPSLKD